MGQLLYCPNQSCRLYRVTGVNSLVKFGTYRSQQGTFARYRCNECGETFSERALTELYGLHADREKIDKVIKEVKKGKSLRQISRESGLKLDTLRYWRSRFLNRGEIATAKGERYNRSVLKRGKAMSLDAASKEVLERAKADQVKFINLQFTDILGSIKSVAIPVERLADVLEKGIWFDGSSILGFVRICESDMILRPDPATYAVTPWTPPERRSARFLCDVHTPDGQPFEGDPRSILKKALAEASKLGYVYNCGPEVEFYLFKKEDSKITTSPHDIGGYFDYSPRDMASNVRKDIVIAMQQMGLTAEMSHHECGPGQHEIDVRYADALTAADNAITLDRKSVV
jgi:transposase-like protein